MATEKNFKWYYVAREGDVPVKEGRRVQFGEHELALFNLGDGYRAIDNRCPHKAGPLADGIVAGNAVFCPLHNWKIDLGSGCALSGGNGQLKTFPVKVINQKVYIAFEEGKLAEVSECMAGQENAKDL